MKDNYFAKIKSITLTEASIPGVNIYIAGISITYTICGNEVYTGGILSDAKSDVKSYTLNLDCDEYISGVSGKTTGRSGNIID